MRVRAKSEWQAFLTHGQARDAIRADEEYLVFEVTNDDYRIWDREGLPLLYPKRAFDCVDTAIPAGWVFEGYADGEYHLGPSSVSSPGFFEDYFEGRGSSAYLENRAVLRRELRLLADDPGGPYRILVEQALSRAGLDADDE